MLHIAYILKESPIHRIGLFAAQDIPQGTLVYSASPLLDKELTQAEFDSLHEAEQKEVAWWGYWDEDNKVWHIDFDVSRFINHSNAPTLTQDPKREDAWLTTLRDIAKGEELTQDYREFESEQDLKQRGIDL